MSVVGKFDKYKITGFRKPYGLRIEGPKLDLTLSENEVLGLYEGRISFGAYTKIPRKLQKFVMLMICRLLGKPFRMELYERVKTEPKKRIYFMLPERELTLDEMIERIRLIKEVMKSE